MSRRMTDATGSCNPAGPGMASSCPRGAPSATGVRFRAASGYDVETVMLLRLELTDFRCHARHVLEPGPGATFLTGPNAAGKTSLLEAAHFIARLKSFRAAQPAALVRHGAPALHVRAHLPGLTLSAGWSPDGRALRVNDTPVASAAEFWGLLPVVALTSADAALVRGPSSERRTWLNALLAQLDRAHLRALLRYRAVLRQRNALITAPAPPDPALLRALTAQLIDTGRPLQFHRMALARLVFRAAAAVHSRLSSSRETLSVVITPARWDRDPAEERAAGRGLIGFHRDQFDCRVNGRSLQRYGSEGQQRTAALALRLAEITLLSRRLENPPLVLVDDVFGELDPDRRAAALSWLPHAPQALLTATPQPWLTEPGAPWSVIRLPGPGAR
jgi:DNA replication and repair protein RecF